MSHGGSRHNIRPIHIATCERCGNVGESSGMFEWTNCYHVFCVDCVIEAVNTSFSLLNEIPTCWCADCDETLDIVDLMTIPPVLRYSMLYQYKGLHDGMGDLVQHDRNELLFAGYIRLSFCQIKFVPDDIWHLLRSFFRTQYFMKIDCHRCNGSGLCGAIKECPGCKGCGVCYAKCTQSTTSSQGNPSHTISIDAMIGNGQPQGRGPPVQRWEVVEMKCGYCAGKGSLFNGCLDCDASGKRMVLDFKSLRKQQILCVKCNKYFPKDMILYWQGCHHRVCTDCISDYLQEVRLSIVCAHQIPCCLVPDCKQGLSVQTMDELKEFTQQKRKHENGPIGSSELDYYLSTYTNIDDEIDTKLRELFHQRDNTGFYCAHCHEWHANEEGFSWSGCGHRFGKKCGSQILDRLLAPSLLPSCLRISIDRSQVPVCEAIVGITSHDHPLYPLQPMYCCSHLTVEDARKLGANHLQLNALQELWISKVSKEAPCNISMNTHHPQSQCISSTVTHHHQSHHCMNAVANHPQSGALHTIDGR